MKCKNYVRFWPIPTLVQKRISWDTCILIANHLSFLLIWQYINNAITTKETLQDFFVLKVIFCYFIES